MIVDGDDASLSIQLHKLKTMIQNMQNVAALIETHERLKTSKYTAAHKQELIDLAIARVNQLEAKQ